MIKWLLIKRFHCEFAWGVIKPCSWICSSLNIIFASLASITSIQWIGVSWEVAYLTNMNSCSSAKEITLCKQPNPYQFSYKKTSASWWDISLSQFYQIFYTLPNVSPMLSSYHWWVIHNDKFHRDMLVPQESSPERIWCRKFNVAFIRKHFITNLKDEALVH